MTLLEDAEWKGWSNVEIASRCAVDEKTVRNLRHETSSDFPKIDPTPRLVTRNGTTYLQNTANIGRQGREGANDAFGDCNFPIWGNVSFYFGRV